MPKSTKERKTREAWGRVRRLPSGRFQASYQGPDLVVYKASSTFEALTDARGWLQTEQTLIDSGEWVAPAIRRQVRPVAPTFGQYADQWVAGKETGMIHVHALQHGSYVLQRLLQEVWGARVDIRKVKTGGVAQYVTKDALKVAGYVVKGATAEHGGLADHLAMNGGRAMHWSRGFFHGLDKRGALASLRDELAGGVPHDWHLEP